mgnify:CR=1 FL=1
MEFVKNLSTNPWVMAIRLHTLPAIVAPIFLGTSIAIHDGVFQPSIVFVVLLCSLLIQIGTNLANDYYDALNSVDTSDRIGFKRATASGLISPPQMKKAWIMTFCFAMLLGFYLLYIGGIPILLIGLLSITAGILYTGGPYPFGYYGLGDAFVFIFFGIIAVTGTYYVQSVSAFSQFPLWFPPGTITTLPIIASISMASLTTSILVVNNIRDMDTDKKAGKLTLSIYLGEFWGKMEYLLLILLGFYIPVYFYTSLNFPLTVLLPLLLCPYGILLIYKIFSNPAPIDFNQILKHTTFLTLFFSILFGIGIFNHF